MCIPPRVFIILKAPAAAETSPNPPRAPASSTHILDVTHLRPGEDLVGGWIDRVAFPLFCYERHQLRGGRGGGREKEEIQPAEQWLSSPAVQDRPASLTSTK